MKFVPRFKALKTLRNIYFTSITRTVWNAARINATSDRQNASNSLSNATEN
jgi:hypothetical protein